MAHDEYNGWTNYETWTVNQWINSIEPMYDYLMVIVRNSRTNDHEKARLLKEWIEAGNPLAGGSTYSDLLGHALSRVNWHEIIEGAKEE